MAVVLPQPLINNAFAPPTNDTNYRSQISSNLGVSGPVRTGVDGSRELTREEQQIMLFGPPQRDVRQDPYAQLGIENKILPDAWVGKNNYIRQVLLNLIRGEKAVWVEEILPWRDWHGGNEITLSRIKFHDHLLDQIPEQGVPRLVIQTHDRQTTTIDRMGLAFHMENGFALTPQGMEDYAMNMLQIQQATVSTACLMVIINLLNAPVVPTNFYGAYHLPYPNPTAKRIFEYEVSTCGMLTVAENGFLKMQSLGIQALAAHGVTPDTLIVPHNCKRAYNWIHPESTDYSTAGPKGPSRLESDGGIIEGQAKMRIVESRPFIFGERDLTMDPMLRDRGFGQFVQMTYRFMPTLNPGERYPLDCLDTMVMDCDNDNVRKIDYWDALAKCGFINRGNRVGVVTGNVLGFVTQPTRVGWIARVKTMFEDKAGVRGVADDVRDAINNFFGAAIAAGNGGFCQTLAQWRLAAEGPFFTSVLVPNSLRDTLDYLICIAIQRGRNTPAEIRVVVEDFMSTLSLFYTGPLAQATGSYAFKFALDLLAVELGGALLRTSAHPEERAATNDCLADTKRICSTYGVPSPFELVVFRPHMIWEMGSAIMMKRGSQTGSTYIGHGDFELGRDVNRKMLLGYYNLYMGPVIERPENIHVLHNVFPNDFQRGGGITIYDAHDANARQAYRTGQMEDADRRDMFACLVGKAIEHKHVDMTGRFPVEIQQPNEPDHYDTAALYRQAWGWETPAVYMDSLSKFFDNRIANVRCSQASQFVWGLDAAGRPNPKAQIVTGSCHFGPSLYPGWVADVCGRGVNKGVLKVMDVTRGSIEAVFR